MAEIFNIWSKSQYFLKEEQNFISANEIDNMVSDTSRPLLSISEDFCLELTKLLGDFMKTLTSLPINVA